MMRERTLGQLTTSEIGLAHGDVRHVRRADDAESIATIQAAIDAGVTLLDTGDFYGMGHNELLIGRPLRGPRPRPGRDHREVRRPP